VARVDGERARDEADGRRLAGSPSTARTAPKVRTTPRNSIADSDIGGFIGFKRTGPERYRSPKTQDWRLKTNPVDGARLTVVGTTIEMLTPEAEAFHRPDSSGL
jgi:hypothetical protein